MKLEPARLREAYQLMNQAQSAAIKLLAFGELASHCSATDGGHLPKEVDIVALFDIVRDLSETVHHRLDEMEPHLRFTLDALGPPLTRNAKIAQEGPSCDRRGA